MTMKIFLQTGKYKMLLHRLPLPLVKQTNSTFASKDLGRLFVTVKIFTNCGTETRSYAAKIEKIAVVLPVKLNKLR